MVLALVVVATGACSAVDRHPLTEAEWATIEQTRDSVEPPVDSMFEVMKSSIEIRKASIAPEKTPGKMSGSVTRRNVLHGPAPSVAATSS